LKIEQFYGDKQDDTMVNYSKFCDDLDIVFNLPVIDSLLRIERKNQLLDHMILITQSHIARKKKRALTRCYVDSEK